MNSITKQPDGSYKWSCGIDKEFHKKSVRTGIWACVIIVAFVLIIYAVIPVMHGSQDANWWIPLLVIGVVLAIALPLFYLQSTAEDPHEQYEMTEKYVKSGYGKGSIYTDFKKVKALVITAKFIELTGENRTNRIYILENDMDFVRQFILDRIPEDADIRYM